MSEQGARIRKVVAAVPDPELPVLTIAELGILRGVEITDDGGVTITVTPTYSGCPALETIRRDVVDAARAAGAERVEVRTVLNPPWSTDWISEPARRKLRAAGIAPPGPAAGTAVALRLSVRCPRCGSVDTEQLSRFGPTACKALWRCHTCQEPFEHTKAY